MDRLTPGSADLHCHPAGDDLARDSLAAMLAVLAATPLDIVAVTDHDDVSLAVWLAALAAAGELPCAIIVGEEITTTAGHLVGLWLTSRVEPGMSLADTVAAVHDQGGIAIVAHPLLPTSISAPGRLLADLAGRDAHTRPDALEAFNSLGAWVPGHPGRVRRFARAHGYATSGGSDAHVATDIGKGRTRFAGRTPDDLRAALLAGTTSAEGERRPASQFLRGAADQLHGLALRPLR